MGWEENPAKANPESPDTATQTRQPRASLCKDQPQTLGAQTHFSEAHSQVNKPKQGDSGAPGKHLQISALLSLGTRDGRRLPPDSRTATKEELHINLPGRNLFPGWPRLEMTGGTSSTLSQGVTGPRWPRFLPGARQEPAAQPALPRSFPVFLRLPRQGNGAAEPGTAGVKALLCQCCQSHAGAARRTRFVLQAAQVRTWSGRCKGCPISHPAPLGWEMGLDLCVHPEGFPTHSPALPLLIPTPRAGGSCWPSPGRALPAPPGHQRGRGCTHTQLSLP